jgi:hypothetical protein
MTSRKLMGLAAGIVLGALSLAAVAVPANAAWWGNGQYQQDNRWNNNNTRYNGYHYREPPVVYATPYNYGYTPPPVVYDNTPGFTIRIQ